MTGDKGLNLGWSRGLSDGVGHIEREKVGAREEAFHCFEADMVGVHVPAVVPAFRADGSLCCVEDTLRLRTYESVLAVGLVPHGRYHNTLGFEFLEGLELSFGLMCKAVTDTKGKSFESKHEVLRLSVNDTTTLGAGAPGWNARISLKYVYF